VTHPDKNFSTNLQKNFKRRPQDFFTEYNSRLMGAIALLYYYTTLSFFGVVGDWCTEISVKFFLTVRSGETFFLMSQSMTYYTPFDSSRHALQHCQRALSAHAPKNASYGRREIFGVLTKPNLRNFPEKF
jgi:hypothetical protein